MNSKTFKPMMLALAGAVALVGAGSVQAQDVIYHGVTTLQAPGLPPSTCHLILSGDITSGVVTVTAGGVEDTGGTCSAIYLGDLPYTGTIASPTFDIHTPRALVTGLGTVCLGAVQGVAAGPSSVGPNGSTATPEFFTISAGGGANFGSCTITTTDATGSPTRLERVFPAI